MWFFVALAVALMVCTDVVPPFLGGVISCAAVHFFMQAYRPPKKPKEPVEDEPAYVSVVGNIASGKSTAISKYERDAPTDVACICEPVDDWATLLEQMVTDKDAWIDLQIVIASFYGSLTAPANVKVFMQERDLMSVALFSGNRKGMATLLLTLVELQRVVLPDVVVHIATSWEDCLMHVNAKHRKQAGDTFASNLGAEYFQALHERHERLLEWYAAQGCMIITVREEDTAVIAMTEAREQAIAARSEGSRKRVTKVMMAALLQLLWPESRLM